MKQSNCKTTYEWRPWTPPSIWADVVLLSNFSSPPYIMDLKLEHMWRHHWHIIDLQFKHVTRHTCFLKQITMVACSKKKILSGSGLLISVLAKWAQWTSSKNEIINTSTIIIHINSFSSVTRCLYIWLYRELPINYEQLQCVVSSMCRSLNFFIQGCLVFAAQEQKITTVYKCTHTFLVT